MRSPGAYWGLRKLLRGYVEPEIELIEPLCHPRGLFRDVGASWGSYTHRALRIGLAVQAFEPQPHLAAVLILGLGGARATVHSVAVSDQTGRAEIRVPKNDIGYATIEGGNALTGSADLSRGLRHFSVPTLALDDLAVGPVSMIKIDVEGHEEAVLRGAAALIKRDTPCLIVEVEERHKKGARAAVYAWLAARGYDCFIYEGRRLRSAGDPPETAATAQHRNLVFVHRRRRPRLPRQLFC